MAEALTIRPATAADAHALAEVHSRSQAWAYRSQFPEADLVQVSESVDRHIEIFRSALEHLPAEHRWWVIEEAGQVVGFNITFPSGTAPLTAEVAQVHLSPEATDKGIDRALFTHVVTDLRQRGYSRAMLWVIETDARARQFYEAAGWSADGASKDERVLGTVRRELRYTIAL
jgi:ribosomal protein S18 acetylase RimI-like enzyme